MKPETTGGGRREPVLLSVGELAAMLGTTPRGIYNMRQRGQLPSPVKFPGLGLRWSAVAVRGWLAAGGVQVE